MSRRSRILKRMKGERAVFAEKAERSRGRIRSIWISRLRDLDREILELESQS